MTGKFYLLAWLVACGTGCAQITAFVEPEAGRAPLTSAFDGAGRSIDLYLFTLTDDAVTASLAAAVARGVQVRALLEPCPGDTGCTAPVKDGLAGCNALLAAGVQVKWANPAFVKTHAKTMVMDGATALVTTINMEPQTFKTRRDYGLSTNDSGVIADFNRVFTQDWQADPPLQSCSQAPSERSADGGGQDYSALIVSPEQGRDRVLGLILSAQTSLKIQVEQVDPQNGRGIVPAMVSAIKAGVRVQLLLSSPADQPSSQAAADAIRAAGGEARFQSNLKPHAKMMAIDGKLVFLGSQNLTRTSLDERREIGWVTADTGVVACFQQVFDGDWDGMDTHLGDGLCPAQD